MSVTSGRSSFLLCESSWIACQPELALKIGNVEASILQFAHGWIQSENHSVGKIHKGQKWIYNSYKAWANEIKIYSEKTIFRAIRNLERMGLLLSEMLHAFRGNRTKWYTISYDKLDALLAPFKPEKPLKSAPQKMTRWSGQNDQILTKIPSKNTSLNSACAHETLQPLVEGDKQPIEVATSITPLEIFSEDEISAQQPLTLEDVSNKALEVVQDIIGSKLDQLLEIDQSLFTKTINKRMGTHFGLGFLGLERFRDYCTTFANNDFLMGQKAMKSGDRFTVTIGSILSTKMIETFWEKTKFFEVYPPKTPMPLTPEEEDMARRKELIPLTPLTLPEVLTTAENLLDKRVKEVLYQALGEATYQSWFHKTGFVAIGIKNGEPEFMINSGFAREYVLTHYGNQLRTAFQRA